MHFDVIVVGARCAGAPLATFLARSGVKVLLLDKDALPSDQVLSTHELHPIAMDVLDELGVGDPIRAVSPPTRVIRIRKGRAHLDVELPSGRFEYCPRRFRLDRLLLEAARAAGVEVRDRTRVVGLEWERGRVRGVRVRDANGEHVLAAGRVIGADGRRSIVANAVRAEEYLGYDAPRAMYWSYWERPAFWNRGPDHGFGMYVGHLGSALRVVFQTDDAALLIGSLPPLGEVARWRSDPRRELCADLLLDPEIAPLVRGRAPLEKVRGTVRERYFVRQAAGPGWALVGDAGLHKEFVTGDGITEALLQARSVTPALVRGGDSALELWWRERDVAALPLYFFGKKEGSLEPPTDLEQALFEKAAARPDVRARIADVLDHALSPEQVLGLGDIWPVVLGGVFRGKWHLFSEFLEAGRHAADVQAELTRRRRLLTECGAGMSALETAAE